MPTPTISVVIPCFREEKRLPGCLDAIVGPAAERGAEVLVVDGGSEDATVARAESYRGRGVSVLQAPRGRGSQMNAGAREARGRYLVFLPADTLLPAEAWPLLDGLECPDAPLAGGFRHRFDRDRVGLRMISRLHDLRARLSGVYYGDQVPFVRRDLFLALGGYDPASDMEDALFGSRLRRFVTLRTLPAHVTTSARRFDRFGDLRATAAAAMILGSRTFLRRVPASQIFFDVVR